jgi:glycosyltransferase involved in cell wall biosynthesis
VSESLRQYFVRRGHLDEQARVIPNGVELASSRTPAASNLRETLHLAPTTPLLGAIGNVRASKGYHVLLQAFATVRATIPEARLVIAGQYHGSLGDHLLELRARLGLDDAVTFLGFRDDVREILEAIDVFVLSSLDEGFSLATVQAMASAVPVVATRSGGPEEIIGDSKAAVLVEPGDATSLARAVIELLTDREQARALGAAARRRVEGRYSLERMLDAYEELYREALSARSSPSLRPATKTSSRMLR